MIFNTLSSQNRKRRSEQSDQVPSTNSTYTPKRRDSDNIKSFSSEKHNIQGQTTTTSSSYFNSYTRSPNKQTYESSVQKQIYVSV